MLYAPEIPPNDIDTFTSLEKFMFMHNLVASATTFLTTDNGKKVNEIDLLDLFIEKLKQRTEQGWCTLKMRLENAMEKGLYLADIIEYLCKHYEIDKTGNKAFRGPVHRHGW